MTRTLLSADSPAIHTDVDEGARGGQVRRIVICEDSRTYASALTRALEHEGAHSVVGVFSSAEETLDALPSLQPDLVTVDLELPGISGLVAIERIMRTGPAARPDGPAAGAGRARWRASGARHLDRARRGASHAGHPRPPDARPVDVIGRASSLRRRALLEHGGATGR